MAAQVNKEQAIKLLISLLEKQHNVKISYELARKETKEKTA